MIGVSSNVGITLFIHLYIGSKILDIKAGLNLTQKSINHDIITSNITNHVSISNKMTIAKGIVIISWYYKIKL